MSNRAGANLIVMAGINFDLLFLVIVAYCETLFLMDGYNDFCGRATTFVGFRGHINLSTVVQHPVGVPSKTNKSRRPPVDNNHKRSKRRKKQSERI